MDNSYSESDVSLSPSQILEKLDLLRRLQVLQRGKLLKHRLDYQNSPEISSNVTEIVSHFSNSTTYNTFRSLLHSSHENSQGTSPRTVAYEDNSTNTLRGKNFQNVIDGVSVLNLSQESEIIPNSPLSSQTRTSNPSRMSASNENLHYNNKTVLQKNQISLDEMPILSPKKDFEDLIIDKLKNNQNELIPKQKTEVKQKKQFLKKGEGMARFGLRKKDLIIQNTKSLPWRKMSKPISSQMPAQDKKQKLNNKTEKIKVQILAPEMKTICPQKEKPQDDKNDSQAETKQEIPESSSSSYNKKIIRNSNECSTSSNSLLSNNIDKLNLEVKSKKDHHPILSNKGKTWAAVLTKEQDDFLRQLKQSEYYKNFSSPTKTVESDISCCESISKATQFKEVAEQNVFDLIENKVNHESFNIENSFFNRFIRQSKLECSGESTPVVMQKCLAQNPDLMHIVPELVNKKRNQVSCCEEDTCMSECTECSECCSISSCCSCQTLVDTQVNEKQTFEQQKKVTKATLQTHKEDKKKETINECQDDNDKRSDTDKVNANIVEMNAKLIATSELLKERLRELEDEIETFRKENANITKMREEIDLERQKFYEEKSAFEQKFNEEKILSEYYLAEEKEKLAKQKQMYERYLRDIRGRLNKKEKDEVAILKKDICDLKEEIRLKDVKSTSTIARLRNQLKLMDKDKKVLEAEVEKLKKENKRIQHSNEVTRRLTNIKYLEQINKKLSNMTSRDTKSEIDLDPNVKYKAFEIEKLGRLKKSKGIRTRAKSVPNLNVTSKYAKYFSQKDSLSDKEKTSIVETHFYTSDNESVENLDKNMNVDEDISESEDNYLEKVYNERFKSNSPSSKRSSGTNFSDSPPYQNKNENTNGFFLQKSNSVSSNKKSISPFHLTPNSSNLNVSKSSSILNDRSHPTFNPQNTITTDHRKSPISMLSNHSSGSHKPTTVIYKDTAYHDARMMPSPEPNIYQPESRPTSMSTNISKTSLNPIETKKSNGTRELRFPNGNVKMISADGKYSKFIYYNGDIKENFYDEGRVKYFYAESKTYHTTHPDGLEVLEFPDGQVEKRYKDGSSEIRLPNGMMRYFDPKNDLVREEWRYPDGTAVTISGNGEQRVAFPNGQIEVHSKDHKRREFPDGTIKLVYNDGTSETRYASGRIRIKDKHGNLIMDSSRNSHNYDI